MFHLIPTPSPQVERFINLSDGIFLLLIIVAGNFVSETFSCKVRTHIENNMYLKNLILLLIVYFTINYTSNVTVPNPIETFKETILIWIMFTMFSKMKLIYMFIATIILLIIYVLNNFRKYHKSIAVHDRKQSTLDKHDTLDKQLLNLQTILVFFGVMILIVGCLLYTIDKKKEYGKHFRVLTFIFGVKKCKNT